MIDYRQSFLENPLKNGTLFKMTVFPSLEKKGANTGKGGVARFSFSLTGKERWVLAAKRAGNRIFQQGRRPLK